MRPRPAPMAARMASSRDRAASRASSRLATFAHAMKSTSDHRRQQHEQPRAVVADDEVAQHLRRGIHAPVELRMIDREVVHDTRELLVNLRQRHVRAPPAVELQVVFVVHRPGARA